MDGPKDEGHKDQEPSEEAQERPKDDGQKDQEPSEEDRERPKDEGHKGQEPSEEDQEGGEFTHNVANVLSPLFICQVVH